MSRMMRELVEVQGGFKPSVQLPNDFFDDKLNRHFVENFIPNEDILNIFKSIRDSLQANAEDRARLFAGTFGTGKSDLMLMIANYVTRSSDDPLLNPFFERLRRLDHAKAESIYQARLHKPPFLLVLLQADIANTFSSFVLNGLANSLERTGLENLLGKTYYRAALDLVESWEQERPENMNRLEEVLATDHGRTLSGLKADLKGPRADSTLDVFQEAVQKAIGMPFAPTAVIQRPADAFNDVARKLVADNHYSGIFVITDEFTHLLQKLAESAAAADSKAIDNLAEVAVRSGQNQLHFYVVSLESFASVQGSTKTSQLALERSGGRFKEYTLKSQNTEELISVAIGKLVPPDRFFEGVQTQFDDLVNLAMRLWDSRTTSKKGRDWLSQIVVQGCFPLHPLTTYCLPRLNEVLAQNQRTMFSFIWDRDRGLNNFITEASAEPRNGWIPLLSLDRMFHYFETNLNEKRLELQLAYQDASRKLSPRQIEQGLEGRLLRSLVMLEVANQRADLEILRHAVGLPASKASEVTQAISELEQAGVAYPSQGGYYQLVKRGGVDPITLRRQIEQRAQTVLSSPLDTLNAQYKPHDVEAERYNSARGTWRQLTARFVSPTGLDSPATLTQVLQQIDGLLWYVVANSEQELEQARSKALQLTRQHPRLVIAVPRTPTDLLIRLQRKHALEALRASPDYQTADYQDVLNDAGLIGKDYINAFQTTRQSFERPQNFDWYRAGRTVTVTMPSHLSSLATTVMKDVFPATPPHKTRQHLKPTGKSKYVQEALDQILQAPFKLRANRKRKSAVEAIILDGAGELGYVYQRGREKGYEEYDVCVPDKRLRDSLKVWMVLEEELKKETPWVEISAALSNPSYGLYPSLLQLLLAAFYRYNQDYLEIYSASNIEGSPLDVTADIIIKVVELPEKYVLRYQPLQEFQRKFLRGLAERALYPGRPIRLQRGETASLRNRVAKLLRHWSGEIPIVARLATQEDLGSIFEDAPVDVLSAAVALMQTALQPQEAATAASLLERLPIQLGLDSDCSHWSDQELDLALAYLESACQYLKKFNTAFKSHMAWQIGQCFDLTEQPKNWNEALTAALHWRQTVVGGIRLAHLSGIPDGRDTLSVLDDEPHSFEQVFLNTLPHRWKFGMFENWQTINIRDEYLQRLKIAKGSIEARASELGISSSEQETTLHPDTTLEEPESTDGKVQPKTPELHTDKTQVQATAKMSPTKVEPESKPAVRTQPESAPDERQYPPTQTFSVDEAFNQILGIFNKLPPQHQYALWARLVEEFDPQ